MSGHDNKFPDKDLMMSMNLLSTMKLHRVVDVDFVDVDDF